MRIPSQFNQDNLYRRRSAPGDSAQSYRRVVRMILGLALVLVLMQQASRPEVYQTFFRPPDLLESAEASTAAGGQSSAGIQGPLKRGGASPAFDPPAPSVADQQIAAMLAAQMSIEQQKQVLATLSRWRHRTDAPPDRSLAEFDMLAEFDDSLDQISDDPALRQRWSRLLNRLQESDHFVPESDRFGPAAEALWRALDTAATQRVVDGSVWRPADFDAFYQYLNQAPTLPVRGVDATGVLPLLQQPDVFRGAPVRVHGEVARAERLPASANLYGITDYWQLWLKPAEGVQRPIVAIVRKVDASIAKIARVDSKEAGASQSNSTNSVPVIVVGRFLKRLAYQSSIGADLAPVLVGQVFELKPVRSPQPMQPAVDDDSVAGTIAMAVLVGLAIAIVVFWRSRANVMRSRRLRYAHRDPPRPFLQAMAKGEFEAREKLPPDGEHSSI